MKSLRATHLDWLMLGFMQWGAAFMMSRWPETASPWTACLLVFGGWTDASPPPFAASASMHMCSAARGGSGRPRASQGSGPRRFSPHGAGCSSRCSPPSGGEGRRHKARWRVDPSSSLAYIRKREDEATTSPPGDDSALRRRLSGGLRRRGEGGGCPTSNAERRRGPAGGGTTRRLCRPDPSAATPCALTLRALRLRLGPLGWALHGHHLAAASATATHGAGEVPGRWQARVLLPCQHLGEGAHPRRRQAA